MTTILKVSSPPTPHPGDGYEKKITLACIGSTGETGRKEEAGEGRDSSVCGSNSRKKKTKQGCCCEHHWHLIYLHSQESLMETTVRDERRRRRRSSRMTRAPHDSHQHFPFLIFSPRPRGRREGEIISSCARSGEPVSGTASQKEEEKKRTKKCRRRRNFPTSVTIDFI